MLYHASVCFLYAVSSGQHIQKDTVFDDDSCAPSLKTIEKLEHQEYQVAKVELLQSRTMSMKALARAGSSSQSNSTTTNKKVQHMHWFRSKPKVRANMSQITKHMEVIHNANNLATKVFQGLAHEMEYELHMDVTPIKSKVALGIINVLGLGCCGIDRCYLGQTCIGITKGLTLGGLAIWATIDYLIIVTNALEKDETIDVFGFNARFDTENGQIETAFWIAVVGLIMGFAIGPLCRAQSYSQPTSFFQQID